MRLDRNWIANLSSNGVSFLTELQRIFQEQAEGYIALLNNSTSLQAEGEVCAQTHRLKGSAGSLGLRKLAALAGEFEKALRDGEESIEALKARGAAMIAEVQASVSALEQYVKEIENKQ